MKVLKKKKKAERNLTLQSILDASADAKSLFFEQNPHVERALQNLELYTPSAGRFFELMWFFAFGHGMFDALGVTDLTFRVTDLDTSVFQVASIGETVDDTEVKELVGKTS